VSNPRLEAISYTQPVKLRLSCRITFIVIISKQLSKIYDAVAHICSFSDKRCLNTRSTQRAQTSAKAAV